MQRYGPPASYPNLKIPGLNAPIPPDCSFGYHPGRAACFYYILGGLFDIFSTVYTISLLTKTLIIIYTGFGVRPNLVMLIEGQANILY